MTSRINDLMTRINASTIPQALKDAINALLGEYVTLLTNQDALENLRSPWYNRENATRIALTAWTRGTQSVELENARTDIETKI